MPFLSAFRCSSTGRVAPLHARLQQALSGADDTLTEVLAQYAADNTFFHRPLDATGATVWHLATQHGDARVLARLSEMLHRHLHSHQHNNTSHQSSNTRQPWSIPDKNGRTPLLIACSRGDIESAKLLIAWGARPEQECDKKGRLAIHLAARYGGEPLVRLLMIPQGHQGNAGCQALQHPHSQQQEGQPEGQQEGQAVQQAGQEGQEGRCDGQGRRQNGQPEAVVVDIAALSEQDTSLAQASGGQSPFLTITSKDLERDDRRLADARAMASATDTAGLTPLHYAAAADDAPSCRLLLSLGAPLLAASSCPCYDTHMPCNGGSTALHVSAMNNSFKAADAMVNEWVNMSAQQRVEQWKPSSGASSPSASRAALLDVRTVLDKEGKTACAVARTRRFQALAELLDPSVPLPEAEELLPARPPPYFLCPITLELMRDPAVISDGFTYERTAIDKWLVVHTTSPMTNLPLSHKAVFPNHALRQAISEWRVQHGLTELPRLTSPPRTPAAPSPTGRSALPRTDGFLRDLRGRRRRATTAEVRRSL